MYSIDEVRLGLDTQEWLLSDGLHKLEEYSRQQGLNDLADWASNELRGYPGVNEDVTTYRRVVGVWKDPFGQAVIVPAQWAIEMARIPILDGVINIEPYLEKGLQIQVPAITAQLNAATGGRYFGADVDSAELQALINRIRMEARKRLNQAVARIPGRSLTYPAPNFATHVSDAELLRILGRRWNEANYCFEAEAYLATIIMLGGILEGVLLAHV